jgi:two-component system, NtrC family, sensor kinase
MEYEDCLLATPGRSGAPAAREDGTSHSSGLVGFEAFARRMPGAWWLNDAAGVYLYANGAAAANLGSPGGSIVGKTNFDLLPAEIAADLRAHDEKVLSTGQGMELLQQLRDDNGTTRTWFTARFLMQVGQERCPAGFAMEITNVLVAKRDADGMLQQILDAITDMVLVKGPHSRLEWANKAFLSVYGMTNAQLAGIIDAPFSEPDLTQQYVKDDLHVFSTGLPLEIPEEAMIRHDGKVLTCHTVKSPIFDSTGKVCKTVAVIRDITERRRLELELRQAQKLESLGRLSSGIAHEINTPIQFVSDETHFVRKGLKGVLELCDLYRAFVVKSERGEVTPEDIAAIHCAEVESKLQFVIKNIPPALEAILDGTNRVAELVQSMKEFAHPDRGDRELADINRALKTTATICANETKYVADMAMDLGELPQVSCYVNELNQVFVNLLVNAAHAIGDVVAGSTEKGKITIKSRHINDDVIVSISDTGMGIPEAIRLKIFDPFFTTKGVGKGTGQGLALALIVVDKHGGSLTFDTEIGLGTTFHIRIPVKAASNPAGSAAGA